LTIFVFVSFRVSFNRSSICRRAVMALSDLFLRQRMTISSAYLTMRAPSRCCWLFHSHILSSRGHLRGQVRHTDIIMASQEPRCPSKSIEGFSSFQHRVINQLNCIHPTLTCNHIGPFLLAYAKQKCTIERLQLQVKGECASRTPLAAINHHCQPLRTLQTKKGGTN